MMMVTFNGQGPSVEYEITGGHHISPPGNLTKGTIYRKTSETMER